MKKIMTIIFVFLFLIFLDHLGNLNLFNKITGIFDNDDISDIIEDNDKEEIDKIELSKKFIIF